jgi:hypothetical protein
MTQESITSIYLNIHSGTLHIMSVTSFSGLRRAAVSSSSLLRRLGDLSVGSQDILGSRIKIDVSSSVTGTVRKDVQALDQRRHVSWGSIVLQVRRVDTWFWVQWILYNLYINTVEWLP